jgi:2,3,4,5-tetrahydropyridine-2-carboxylate N-succinyltransferase
MGTLSGGGKEVISVGQRTLLGANSGIGISLGNDCIVEAGIYITAGSKISLPDGKIVKAKELSGANNLLFRRNSQSGSLEVLPKTGTWSGLNSVLHNN